MHILLSADAPALAHDLRALLDGDHIVEAVPAEECPGHIEQGGPDALVLALAPPAVSVVRARLDDLRFEVPVLVVCADPAMAGDLLEAGADDVVVLPTEAGVLGHRLRLLEERARIRAEAARLNALFAGTESGVLIIDSEGRIIDSNQAASSLFGYSPAEFRSLEHLEAIVAPAERHLIRRARTRLVANEASTTGSVLRWLHKDGTLVDVEIAAWPFRDKGRVAGLVVEAREVSEEVSLREAMQEEVEQARRGRVAVAIAAELAREWESTIATLSDHHMIAAGESLQEATDRVQVLAGVISDLNDERSPGTEDDVDLSAIVDRGVGLFRASAGEAVEVRTNVPDTPVRTAIPVIRFELVLSEMLLLARDVSGGESGGKACTPVIELELHSEPGPAPDATEVGLVAQYRAPSMSFDAPGAVRRKAALRQLVTSLGGSVAFYAGPEFGFIRVGLPAGPREARASAPAGIPVLLLDDDLDTLEYLDAVLQREGYALHGATSIAAAHRLLLEGDFCAILLSLQVSGMSGWDLLGTLRDRYPETPVIMLGRFASQEDARQHGAHGIVANPFDVREVLTALAGARDRVTVSGPAPRRG